MVLQSLPMRNRQRPQNNYFKNKINVEVIEVYPDANAKMTKNTLEKGTCHIKITPMGLEVKNIPYQIKKNGMIWVGSPAIPRQVGEERVFVPTVKFEDQEIWKLVINEIRKEIESLQK